MYKKIILLLLECVLFSIVPASAAEPVGNNSVVVAPNAPVCCTDILCSRMLSDINSLRTQNGIPSLVPDASLTCFAFVRSVEASSLWSHTRPDGTLGTDMIDRHLWRGENLAYVTYYGYTGNESELASAEQALFSNLCSSWSHRGNMLFSGYSKVGICYHVAPVDGGGTKLTLACLFSG